MRTRPLWLSLCKASITFLPCVIHVGCKTHLPVVALLAPTTGVPIWDTFHAGAVEEAKVNGCHVQVRYDAPPSDDDFRAQLDLLQQSRDAKVSAIVIATSQPQALRNPLQRIARTGLPVVILGEDLGVRDPHLLMVLNDDVAGGRLAAQAAAGALEGRGSIAILGVDVSRASSLIRERAVEQELAEHFPGVRVVTRIIGTHNLTREQEAANAVLSSSPRVDAFLALNNVSTRGAYYAALNNHLLHRVHIVGFDQDLIQPLRTGEIDAIVAQKTFDMGQAAIKDVCARLHGEWAPTVLSFTPFLITPKNFNSPEVLHQFEQTWWDERGE